MDRNTIFINNEDLKKKSSPIGDILDTVFVALEEKGYNAIDQLVGYIISGDPSYITGHNNARNIIKHVERDEILEELIKTYIESRK